MARFTPLHIIPALIAAASHAGEVTIQPRPFTIVKSFSAAVLPSGEITLIRVDPKSWSDFRIAKILPHGSRVIKDDSLIQFDSEDFDKKLDDLKLALETTRLTLAQAELDAKVLQETSPNRLEALQRAADIAKEENLYFTKTQRKAKEETASQALKRNEQMLANQREELKQLSKMYEADDITEETEEIILTRQQDAVATAEFALRMEILDHKRTLDVLLPRQAKSLAETERDSALALKKAEADIPRAIHLSNLALTALKTTTQRAENEVTELSADRELLDFRAPADGWFYHGPIDNGRWTPGELVKSLVPFGRPPVHAPIATFVPATAPIALVSFVDDSTARSLAVGATGAVTLAGREDVEIPVKLEKLAPSPGPDGNYRADLSVVWPKDLTPPSGAIAQVRLVSYQKPLAIVVPTKAVEFANEGWTVEVKLADGKTERRPVERGRVSAEETEIFSGLEAGQVILVP